MSILVSFQLTRHFQPQKIQPELARTLETNGLATILLTGIGGEGGVPWTVGVEFPFGHTLRLPVEVAVQRCVIGGALMALSAAKAPGSIVYSQEK